MLQTFLRYLGLVVHHNLVYFRSLKFQVDDNVTRHLDGRLAALHDWDLLILHYLGLDHIGHVQGPNGDAMPTKMREMDIIIGKIVFALVV